MAVSIVFAASAVAVGFGGAGVHPAGGGGLHMSQALETTAQHLTGKTDPDAGAFHLGCAAGAHNCAGGSDGGVSHSHGVHSDKHEAGALTSGTADDCGHGDCCTLNYATLADGRCATALTSLDFENWSPFPPLHADLKYADRPPRLS
jgi:hypothetical protein